jgi:hypothetical protein
LGAVLAFAGDLDGLGGVREQDSGGDGDDLVGAGDPAAVAGVGLAVSDRDVLPRLPCQVAAQILLVALDGEDVVRASAVEVGGVLTLGVEGIGGDDHLGEIVDLVEECGEHGYFVGLLADLDLAERHSRVMVQAGHEHPCAAVADSRASKRLTVDGDRAARRPYIRLDAGCLGSGRGQVAGEETADRGVEPVPGERRERPSDRGRVRRADPHPRRVSSTASAAHSAIAANDRAPETTAHTDTNRIAENRCRTPRFLRGSGTDSNTSSKPPRACGATTPHSGAKWRDRTAMGDDDTAGTARAPKVTMA